MQKNSGDLGDMIKVFFDGSCEPVNPGGDIRYGAVIFKHEEIIYEIAKKINLPTEERTNNVAEYCGLISAINYLLFHKLENEEIYIFGDSKLVIMQSSGLWNANGGAYMEYYSQAQNKIKKFTNLNFEWISKEKNKHADKLSRQVK